MDHYTPHKPAKIGLLLAATLALVGITASTHAAPPAPVQAYAGEIDFVDLGSSLAVGAQLYGLDRRRDVFVTLEGEAEVEVACFNPAGIRVAAQTPAPLRVTLDGAELYPRRAIRFGRLDIEVYTDALGSTIAGAPDCPNPRWTERVERVRFRRARLGVRQGGRDEIDLLCNFTRPSSDGRIPRSRVRCFAV
jgi:hypothetical protein